MPTLILTPRFTDDSQLLWRAALEAGWHVERLHGWRVPDELRTVSEPVLYVEGLMAPMIAREFGLILREPPQDWLPRLPEEYRWREIQLMTLGQARQLRQPMFCKPPNDKSFPARVYGGDELPDYLPDSQPVLVAEPVNWLEEFRCFLLDRRVVTFSLYLRHGEVQKEQGYYAPEEEQAQALRYVDQLLTDERVQLPRAVVLDVGRIQDRGWAVVELNAAWGSGIYGCEPRQVLPVLRLAMEKV